MFRYCRVWIVVAFAAGCAVDLDDGDACSDRAVVCQDGNAFECHAFVWREIECRGVAGCTTGTSGSSQTVACDMKTTAQVGDGCFSADVGKAICDAAGQNALECTADRRLALKLACATRCYESGGTIYCE